MSQRPRIPAAIRLIPMAQSTRMQAAPMYVETARARGRAVMEARARIFRRDGPNCGDCRTLVDITPKTSHPCELDHTIPLWNGGADDDTNRRLLCLVCHAAKTKREAAERAKGG